jgi:hypothetical protein
MYSIVPTIIYVIITFVIGYFLLSGFFCIINEFMDKKSEKNDDDDSYIIDDDLKTINLCDMYEKQNSMIERFLFWIYLINSGYTYVHANSSREHDDIEYNNYINLLYLNLGGIFIFFTSINSVFYKRKKNDTFFFCIYISTYIISLHFNMISSDKLNNIVLTYKHAKSWDFSIWVIVIFLFSYIFLWLSIKFYDFSLRSVFIFKFYSLLFFASIIIILLVSILYIKLHNNILHVHHYFVGCLLIVFSPSFYYPNNKTNMCFINPKMIHISTIITQAILLGIIIDGVTNYGAKTIFV